MSRALAGFGAALGTMSGGIAGLLIGERIPKQPGYTPADDEALVLGVAAAGSLIGAVVGAVVGAGPDPKQITVGTSGVGDLRSEWKL
jgi:hypothetical protein